jgi:hypothetical protein
MFDTSLENKDSPMFTTAGSRKNKRAMRAFRQKLQKYIERISCQYEDLIEDLRSAKKVMSIPEEKET